MNKKIIKSTLTSIGVLIFAGCKTYTPMSISHSRTLDQITTVNARQDEILSQLDGVNLSVFAEIMSENNPELISLKGEYDATLAIATISTPLPNPTLELGMAKGKNLIDPVTNASQPFIGLGFTIPLGGKLSSNDDYNEVVMQQKRTTLVSRHRELYMEFRQTYLSFLLAKEELVVIDSIHNTSLELIKNSEELAKMGLIGRLGILDSKFDMKGVELRVLESQQDYFNTLEVFARLVGTSQRLVGKADGEVPTASKVKIPDFAKMLDLVATNNAQLANRKREFEVADADLKRQLSQQYPDLNFGMGGEKEPGEKTKTFSLSIGINLPIFDRNQQGIAEAEKRRELIIKQYNNDVQMVLTRLERLEAALGNAKKQMIGMEELVALSTRRLMAAKQSLQAGAVDLSRFLDMKREHDLLLITKVDKKRAFWQLVFELESTIGLPLTELVGEHFESEAFEIKKLQDNKVEKVNNEK